MAGEVSATGLNQAIHGAAVPAPRRTYRLSPELHIAIPLFYPQVHDPARTFPRALLLAVFLVVLMYLLPIMAALGVTTDTSDWSMGYFGRVADQVGDCLAANQMADQVASMMLALGS